MCKKMTGKTVLQAVIIISSFSMASSYASNWDETPEDSSEINYREGHIGAGTGALTGAAIGGPPGLIVGAVIGKFIGRDHAMQKRIDESEHQVQALQAQLTRQQTVAIADKQVSSDIKMQVASMADISIQRTPDVAEIINNGVSFSIHFRTDSDQMEQHIIEQCRTFTTLSKLFPDLVVVLKGYADPRGETSYNLSLSQRRLDTVRQLLRAEGVDDTRIEVMARGEEALLNPEDDRESYSFERRVDVIFSQREERS